MSDDLYQEIILEEYAHPRYFGKLADADVTLPGINPSCGDALMLYLKIDPSTKVITKVMWDGEGCAISMAAMSLLAHKINQAPMTLAQLTQLQKKDLEEMLGLEEVITGREKCIMLGLQTLQTYVAHTRQA